MAADNVAIEEIEVEIPEDAFLRCYRRLLKIAAIINLLFGGRDSGKSYFIACILIKKCLEAVYFKCILIKKTGNSIQESQWETLKRVTKRWGMEDEFTFKTHPLTVECENGNRFIARGCDDPDNIKSIENPTDVWYEEGNQLELTDFITIASSLRSDEVEVQQWLSFNPEADGDFEEFWIYKAFYAGHEHEMYGAFSGQWEMPMPDGKNLTLSYTSTHTTYHDNPHVSPARIALLEYMGVLDPYYAMVFTDGKWGNRKNEDPFCLTYDKQKHKKPTKLDRRREVMLSFDFNVNPITCGVYQWYPETNTLRVIRAIKLSNSDIYKLCDEIIKEYKGCMFLVTGDATGRNTVALVQDGINYYTVIKNKLNLSAGQLKTPTINPKVSENRVLVNAAFKELTVEIDPVNAKELTFDLENVGVNDVGDIDKGDRANPKKRADHLDHFRYMLNTFFRWILKQ